MIRRSLILSLYSLVSYEFHCVYGLTQEFYLTKATGSQCQALQIGPAWTSPSPMVCFIVCKNVYPSDCNSIVYNDTTSSCVPATRAFSPVETYDYTIPNTTYDGAIYFAKTFPECNVNLGFVKYDVCGISACLYIPNLKTNYLTAVDECASKNATLFSADSLEKFSFFWTLSLSFSENTYLGLTDLVEEGKFVWANGNSLSNDLSAYIWGPNQPDNAGQVGESCVEARHKNWPGVYGLNDVTCNVLNRFICE